MDAASVQVWKGPKEVVWLIQAATAMLVPHPHIMQQRYLVN